MKLDPFNGLDFRISFYPKKGSSLIGIESKIEFFFKFDKEVLKMIQ